MKRRSFNKSLSLGVGSGLLSKRRKYSQEDHHIYPKLETLKNAYNNKEEIAIRLAFTSITLHNLNIGNVQISILGQGKINRIKTYFLEPPDQHTQFQDDINLQLFKNDLDVIVVWAQKITEESILQIDCQSDVFNFTIKELLKKGQLEFNDNFVLTSNLLGYHEIGSLDLRKMNIPNKEEFRFVIMADPQGGNPDTPSNKAPTRIKSIMLL